MSLTMSLDGFIEGPNHDLSWHRFWPIADQYPDTPAPMIDLAGIWREMPKIVYSRTRQSAALNTTIFREVKRDEVIALRDEDVRQWDRDAAVRRPRGESLMA